jgi:glycosyltransferase involved in cell wall biosynthesis
VKIVYLSPAGQLGGAEMSLLDMLASLRAAEPRWSLQLVAAADGPLTRRAEALGVTTTLLSFPRSLSRLGDAATGGPAGDEQSRLALGLGLLAASPSVALYVRRLRRLLRKLSPDIIHSNGLKMHLLGAWAKPAGVPLIWHLHDYLSRRFLMARLLSRLSQKRRAALVIANSLSVAADMREVCGRAGPEVLTVYNGIYVERFAPVGPSLDLDALSGLAPAPPETVRVGILATLARWKGHQVFLRALSLLPPALPVRAYVISGALYQTNGSQHSLAELKQQAGQLGLSARVGFTGFLSEPAQAMRALDIIVHASTEPEPFGLVIAEAMACGRAVIISEAGGAAELIERDVNALVHPPGDAARLAERIAHLATEPHLRARLGAAARRTAEQRFDRARLATELIPLYRAVTAAANSPR